MKKIERSIKDNHAEILMEAKKQILAKKRKLQAKMDRIGTTSVTLELPNVLLKKINKRMAKRNISHLPDYLVTLIFSDLENS
jgi:hypothetical protein